MPPQPLALVSPLSGCSVTAPAVASLARRHLILDPARPTLDPWHHVLGRRGYQIVAEFSATPDALGAIALNDQIQPSAPTDLVDRWTT